MSQTNARLSGGGLVLPVGATVTAPNAGEKTLSVASDGTVSLLNPDGSTTPVGGNTAGVSCVHYAKASANSNITLSGEQTIDGIACVTLDRVFLFGQTAPAENGIWTVSTGAWTRAADFDESTEIFTGALVMVQQGTVGAGVIFQLSTTGAITVGSTSLAWLALARKFSVNNSTSTPSTATDVWLMENAGTQSMQVFSFAGTRKSAIVAASVGVLDTHATLSQTRYMSLDGGTPGDVLTPASGFAPVTICETKGSDVASASTISPVGGCSTAGAGNFHHVTGTTNIDFITYASGASWTWLDGSVMELYFVGALTLNHGTGSPPANTYPLECPGNVNLALAAGSVVTFRRDVALTRWVVTNVVQG